MPEVPSWVWLVAMLVGAVAFLAWAMVHSQSPRSSRRPSKPQLMVVSTPTQQSPKTTNVA